MKHALQVGNQYPSWTSTRHSSFRYIGNTEQWTITPLVQSIFSMSWCKLAEGLVAFVRTEISHNRYFYKHA